MQFLDGHARLVLRAVSFIRRDPRAALLLLRMAAWVVALSLLIKVLPLPRVLRLITTRRRATSVSDPIALSNRLAHLLDALLATDKLSFTPTCWKRAPVLHRYLALNGIETRIVFGIRKEANGELAGHAWLESEQQPVLESTPPKYTVTYAFPA